MILIGERLKTGLKKRKVKVFLLFLLFSTLAWLVNNLSQTFVSTTSFTLEYSDPPLDFLLVEIPAKSIDVRLKAVGFRFMSFEIRKQHIKVDLSKISTKNGRYYISPKVFRKQISNQLSKSMELVQMEDDTLFLDLIKLVSKEVPVIARANIDLAANYTLASKVKVTPKTVTLRGPKNEIDTINSVRTSYVELVDVSTDFSKNVSLLLPKMLASSKVDPSAVRVSGEVFRFSEQVVSIPIEMINVPDSVRVRMFPDRVDVLCQGKISELKTIESKDFRVIGDYNAISVDSQNRLPIVLDSFPSSLSKAILQKKEIEFILRRQ